MDRRVLIKGIGLLIFLLLPTLVLAQIGVATKIPLITICAAICFSVGFYVGKNANGKPVITSFAFGCIVCLVLVAFGFLFVFPELGFIGAVILSVVNFAPLGIYALVLCTIGGSIAYRIRGWRNDV